MRAHEFTQRKRKQLFAKSIWLLFVLSALLETGCATTEIPNVRLCAEIPFIDAPEGACIWTVTHKEEIITPGKWKELRPYMLMLDPDGWAAIKKNWLEACRIAGPDCNVQVDSVEKVIRALDALAGAILQ